MPRQPVGDIQSLLCEFIGCPGKMACLIEHKCPHLRRV